MQQHLLLISRKTSSWKETSAGRLGSERKRARNKMNYVSFHQYFLRKNIIQAEKLGLQRTQKGEWLYPLLRAPFLHSRKLFVAIHNLTYFPLKSFPQKNICYVATRWCSCWSEWSIFHLEWLCMSADWLVYLERCLFDRFLVAGIFCSISAASGKMFLAAVLVFSDGKTGMSGRCRQKAAQQVTVIRAALCDCRLTYGQLWLADCSFNWGK